MARGVAIALGNFDGLHAGHRAVIESARAEAVRLAAPLGVATFEPAPRRHFQPDAPPFRLMTPIRRELTLKSLGVQETYLLRFDAAMAAMSDREFCANVVVGEIGAKSVSVGFDFRFGKGRMGDAEGLQRLGAELGFDVRIVAEVQDGGEKVSSSRIREAIERGDMDTAARGLEQLWAIDAIVEHGEKRGRTIGFPTANMQLGEIVHPAHGVYAVWARLDEDRAWRPGVANFGRTPTTGLRDPLLEVMVFDVSGDFYGRRLHTAFVKLLRPELKFDSLEALVDQMEKDVTEARAVLAAEGQPSFPGEG